MAWVPSLPPGNSPPPSLRPSIHSPSSSSFPFLSSSSIIWKAAWTTTTPSSSVHPPNWFYLRLGWGLLESRFSLQISAEWQQPKEQQRILSALQLFIVLNSIRIVLSYEAAATMFSALLFSGNLVPKYTGNTADVFCYLMNLNCT